MHNLRYIELSYPYNLLRELGLPSEESLLLEEKISELDDKLSSVLLGRYRDNYTAQVMAKEFNCSKKTIYASRPGDGEVKNSSSPRGYASYH